MSPPPAIQLSPPVRQQFSDIISKHSGGQQRDLINSLKQSHPEEAGQIDILYAQYQSCYLNSPDTSQYKIQCLYEVLAGLHPVDRQKVEIERQRELDEIERKIENENRSGPVIIGGSLEYLFIPWVPGLTIEAGLGAKGNGNNGGFLAGAVFQGGLGILGPRIGALGFLTFSFPSGNYGLGPVFHWEQLHLWDSLKEDSKTEPVNSLGGGLMLSKHDGTYWAVTFIKGLENSNSGGFEEAYQLILKYGFRFVFPK